MTSHLGIKISKGSFRLAVNLRRLLWSIAVKIENFQLFAATSATVDAVCD